jgi:hypothetical protein
MQTQTKNENRVRTTPTENDQRISGQPRTYRVGHINFIVTPVYPSGRGESMTAILLKLMNTDMESRK